MEFYWELIQFDDTRIEIPPASVELIQRRMDAKQPIHTLHSGSIPTSQIKHFRPTDKLFGQQNLIADEASQLFNEPVINKDGSIACKWVKKYVTQRAWEKDLSLKGFKRIGEYNGFIVIAIFKPIHLIDPTVTPNCTPDEVEKLERGRRES